MSGGQLCLGAPCPLEHIHRPPLEPGPQCSDGLCAALRRKTETLYLAERHECCGVWRGVAEQAGGAEGLTALERL